METDTGSACLGRTSGPALAVANRVTEGRVMRYTRTQPETCHTHIGH